VEQLGGYGLLLTGLAVAPLLMLSKYPGFSTPRQYCIGECLVLRTQPHRIISGNAMGFKWTRCWNTQAATTSLRGEKKLHHIFGACHGLYGCAKAHLHVHRYSVGTAIALAISLIYAAFSWRLLERPLMLGGEAKQAIEPRNRAQS
jgi:hypothetical protein